MTIPFSSNAAIGNQGESKLPLAASPWLVIALAVLSCGLAILAGLDGLSNLYNRWAHEDEYGYGFLAAALVIFLLWQQRNQIKSFTPQKRWLGVALVIGAQLFGLLGALSESYFVQQIAFIVTLLGIALVTFGANSIRFFVPLALILLLTVPLPYTLQAIITLKLQLLSTNLGVAAIRIFGIPVFVEGNVIDLGQYKLQVAEACSGLRYLLPFTCISFILAYLYRAPNWKRAIIVASAPPITVLINSFRIAVVAVLVDNFGSGMAEGFVHDFEGWVIFLFGGALLAVEILVLEGFSISRLTVEPIIMEQGGSASHWRPAPSFAAVVTTLTCAIAVITITSIAWVQAGTPGPSRNTFSSFPQRVGDWSSHESQLDPAILAVLKSTDYFVSDFSIDGGASSVNAFVAYYDSLNKGAAIHSPQVCLPASGWEFASIEKKNFLELAPEASGTFNRVVVQKGEQKILMYYWFQQRERRTADEFSMKYYLLIDSVMKSRRDGALVRIYTRIPPGEKGATVAEATLQKFARTIIPAFREFLPQ